MALKKRFAPQPNPIPETQSPPPVELKIIAGGAAPPQTEEHTKTQTIISGDTNTLKKRLAVYRRINDLYQEKGIEFNQLMQGLLDLIVSVTEAEGGSLWMRDKKKNEVTCQLAVGPGSETLIGVTLSTGKGIVGWVAQNNQSTLVKDTETDERFSDKADRKSKKKFSTRSIIAAPLCYSGDVIGVIEIVNKKTTANQNFTEEDQSFLDDICTPTAMHITTCMNLKSQESLLKRMEVFRKIHEDFSATLELNKLLGLVLNQAIELLGAEVGSIWLLDAQNDKIECKIAEGPTKQKVIGVKMEKGTGIIGWVIDNHKPSIVEDCAKDARFSSEIDKKIGFETRSMLSAPLMVKGECIGAIQIINKKDKHVLFNSEDLNLLCLFASSSAMYIKNAQLFDSEKKAKELSALISISKEITSTLDLDSVLMSIVNLSSNIINYTQATISRINPRTKQYEVQAISGIQAIDRTEPEAQELRALHEKLAEFGKDILVNHEEYIRKSEGIPELKEYMKKKELKSFGAHILKDDQGELGVFTMESQDRNMIPENKKELLSILVSQCTVAMRNAELYTTIPNSKVFTNFRQYLLDQSAKVRGWPLDKKKKAAAIAAGAILSLFIIHLPWNVTTNIEIIPVSTTYYAQSSGTISEVIVKEGQRVSTGDVLARLDTSDLILSKKQKESTRQRVVSELLKLQSEGKIAEYKIKEAEKLSLDAELEMLERQLKNLEIKSTTSGMVASANLDELIGKPVSFGQELVKIARSDKVFVQFEVPEKDVPLVESGQKVKFKVFGHPNTSFSSGITLRSVAGEAKKLSESSPDKYFIARAEVPNDERSQTLLRPGMTGRGKIYTPWKSLAYLLFIEPMKIITLRLFF